MAGRAKASAGGKNATELTLDNAASRSDSNLTFQAAADFAEGGQQAKQAISNLIRMAAEPDADPVVFSALQGVFDASSPESRSIMLDIAKSHGEGHPLLGHSEQIAGIEGSRQVEPSPVEQPSDSSPPDLRYNLTMYGGKPFRDAVRKRFGVATGNSLNTLMGQEIRVARGALEKRGFDPAVLDALPQDQLLSLLTPQEMELISSNIDADQQRSRGAFGQQDLGGRGGETLLAALNAARNSGNPNATIPLSNMAKWWRAGFAESTPSGELVRSPNALHEQMLSGLIGDALGQGPDFRPTYAPIIGNSVRAEAALPPSTNSYRGGRSEAEWAQTALKPSATGMNMLKLLASQREGVPFQGRLRTDTNWGRQAPLEHPMFSDIPLNRGDSPPAWLGSDIVLPDQVELPAPSIDRQSPPAEPSSGDVGFLERRMQPGMPQILAGLLAA